MTTLTLSLILVMLLTSALSAVIGDQLGRKIGKKKWSIFTLRPRHTSTVLTMLISMTAAMGALGILLLVSSTVRMALLNPDQPLASSQEAYEQHLAKINHSLQRFQKLPGNKTLAAKAIKPVAKPAPLGWEGDLTDNDFQLTTQRAAPAWKTAAMPVRMLPNGDTSMAWPTQNQSSRNQPVTRTTDGEAEFRQALLENNRSIPQVQLIAQAGDVLASLEVPGTQSAEVATAIVQEVLRLADRYAQELGAQNLDGAFIQVANGAVSQVQKSLGGSRAFTLQVTVAHPTTTEQPLPISLVLTPKVTQNIDPHEILERERLMASANPQRVDVAYDEVITATVKNMQARQQPVAEFPRETTPGGFKAPALDAVFTSAPVRFSTLTQQQFTLVGRLVVD